jgi:hypothetical protein
MTRRGHAYLERKLRHAHNAGVFTILEPYDLTNAAGNFVFDDTNMRQLISFCWKGIALPTSREQFEQSSGISDFGDLDPLIDNLMSAYSQVRTTTY